MLLCLLLNITNLLGELLQCVLVVAVLRLQLCEDWLAALYRREFLLLAEDEGQRHMAYVAAASRKGSWTPWGYFRGGRIHNQAGTLRGGTENPRSNKDLLRYQVVN